MTAAENEGKCKPDAYFLASIAILHKIYKPNYMVKIHIYNLFKTKTNLLLTTHQ